MSRMLLMLTLVVGFYVGVESKTPGTINWAAPLEHLNPSAQLDGCDCVFNEGYVRIFPGGVCEEFRFAAFSISVASNAGCNPYTISYLWDFGDGNTSTLQYPVHSYAADGSYTVTLTVTITTPSGTCVYNLSGGVVVVDGCFPDPPCELLDCDSVSIVAVWETGVKFEFPYVDCEECEDPDYTIGWRPLGDTTWNYGNTIFSTSGNGGVFGLDSCTQYEVIIELRCNENEDPDAECTFSFTTTGCGPECIFDCDSVIQTGASYDRIYFSFLPIDTSCTNCDDPYYDVSWRVAGSAGAWNYCCTSVAPHAGTGSIWGLSYCTQYEFRIELRCGGSHLSPVLTTCGPVLAGTRCFSSPPDDKSLLPGASTTADILVYPNPAKASVKFVIKSEIDAEGVIKIYNNMGMLVRQINAMTNSTQEINTEDLSAGIYYYRFSTEDQRIVHQDGKLIITN